MFPQQQAAGILLLVVPLISAQWMRMEVSDRKESDLSGESWNFFQRRNRNKTLSSSHTTTSSSSSSTPHFQSETQFPFGIELPLPRNAILPNQQMLYLLGSRSYNPNLVSVSEPWQSRLYPQGRLLFPRQRHNLTSEVISRSKVLTLYTRSKREITQRTLHRVGNVYTACPLQHTWRDYGPRYWPRWVREGTCVNLGGTSCSLPPGMLCQPYRQTTVAVLRYICPAHWAKSMCNWHRMQVPLLTACKCGCTTTL